MTQQIELDNLMKKIGFPEAAIDAVSRVTITESEYIESREFLYRNEGAFFEAVEGKENWRTWALRFYLEVARETYSEYRKRGISEQIYYDTVHDFLIWYEDCLESSGIHGLQEQEWLSRVVKMDVFALGRLEFAPFKIEDELRCNGRCYKPGTPALYIHVPGNAKLIYEECTESFRQADQFFGAEYELYFCESWLLAPGLKEFMAEKSNIIQFQERFDIISVNEESTDPEEWIFGEVSEDKTHYVEDTTLQRDAKQLLLRGEKLGVGTGIIIR